MSDDLLKAHRDAIDAIDAEMLKMLNQRAEHARTIGEIKGGGVVYRPSAKRRCWHASSSSTRARCRTRLPPSCFAK